MATPETEQALDVYLDEFKNALTTIAEHEKPVLACADVLLSWVAVWEQAAPAVLPTLKSHLQERAAQAEEVGDEPTLAILRMIYKTLEAIEMEVPALAGIVASLVNSLYFVDIAMPSLLAPELEDEDYVEETDPTAEE